jgi:integrase
MAEGKYFDARAAKLLQPGEHLMVRDCPGLRLVATPSTRTWTYRYKDAGGRMKQLKLGAWPAMGLAKAIEARDAQSDVRAGGTDPGQARRDARAAARAPAVRVYDVRQLVADYVDGHLRQARKEAGAVAAERALDRFLQEEPELAAKAAAEFTRADAFTVLERRKDTPTSTAKLRSMMGSAWDYALDAGRLHGDVPNWWRVVMKGRLKSRGKIVGGEHQGRQARVLPPVEVWQLLKWLPNMHALGRDATELYLWTCARGVEILALRPERVTKESDGTWWTVPKAETKNARYERATDLRIPLEGRALEVVERRIKSVGKSGWLFEDARGEQYTQHDFSTYVYSLQPDSAKAKARKGTRGPGLVAPVTNWTPHDLRRTSRTLLSSLGCPQEIAEAILGHLPAQIVATYNAYTYDAERRLWLGKLSAYLEALACSVDGVLPARR